MSSAATFLAVDLGASNGRVMAGHWDGERFTLQEAHRFPNGAIQERDGLHWDAQGIWQGILTGLRKHSTQCTSAPAGIGIDAWGVDFGLLNEAGELLGNPFHYRDARTNGMMEVAAARCDDARFYQATGVQPMSINTVYQLMSMTRARSEQLDRAHRLLMIPDLFQHCLCGSAQSEYTEATTTQLYNPTLRNWDAALMRDLDLPSALFAPVVMPGTVLGVVKPEVAAQCGFAAHVPSIAVASHDTASAVAAIPRMDEQSAFLSCGTWSLLGAPTAHALLTAECFQLGFTNEGAADGGNLVIRNLTGLWILQECVRVWQEEGASFHWEDLLRAAATAPALQSFIDTQDAAFAAPSHMPKAIAAWCAETRQPIPQTHGEFARCILESLCLAYRHTLRDLSRATARTYTSLRIVGGGARNTLLCQWTADACACTVIAAPVEAAALGNVLMQAIATKHIANIDEGHAILTAAEPLQHYAPRNTEPWTEAAARLERMREERIARQHAAVLA